jgi:hypothetical protein
MNLARHKGYKTVANAKKKLTKEVGDLATAEVHWVIAVNEQGRFVPCAIGGKHFHLIHQGITVLG